MDVVAKRNGEVAETRSGSSSNSRVAAWVVILGLAQLADLATTQVAMSRGAIEGNQVAAFLIAVGGLGLLWFVKASLVAAMAIAVWLVTECRKQSPTRRWVFASSLVWRGLQVCVLVLALTAIHNLTVIGAIEKL
jgi:sterol desaturase/sphingolipid hydroxylase (fatty acid hydroxylase superfamily)